MNFIFSFPPRIASIAPLASIGVCLLTIFATSTLQAQEPTVITVPNAGFESGTALPDKWTFDSAEGSTGRLEWSDKGHNGGRAARMVKTNGAGHTMLVSDFIPVTAGKSYEVSAQVHVEGRSRANVYFMVSQYSADSGEMRLPNLFSAVHSIDTGAGWKPLSLAFPVREGSARVRVHALVTAAPIDILWDDFQLRETTAVDQSYKPFYEMATPEVLPPLEPAMEHLKKRKPSVAERHVVNGRPRFFLDGKMVEPTLYVGPFANYADAQIGDFKDVGVKLYLVPLILGRGVYGNFGPWLGKNQFDWKEVDERLWRILRVNPDAHIMFYMATDPYLKWADENPDAIVRDQHGQKSVVTMHTVDWGREPTDNPGNYKERWGHSYVSPALRRDTAEALRQLTRYVQNSLPGKAVAGYHIAGGNDGQFFQWAGFKGGNPAPANYHLADYSPDSRAAFRDWLRRKYRDVNALRRAWNKPDVTFESADIPAGERRMSNGFFFDAKTDEDIADYNRFYSEGTVETIHGYARIIKEETRGQKLVSTYWEDTAAGVDSHFATGRMLQSPDIDFLAGPTAYGVRLPGEVGASHAIWGSSMLRDRIWVSEQDFRSWHSTSVNETYDFGVGRATTASDHNNMVRRESGMMLAFGQGTWWYDMNGGWFADENIMRGVKEAQQAFTRDLSTTGLPRAEMAVFVSERSLDYFRRDAAGFRFSSISQQIRELNRSGVPYQIFLQEDLNNPKLPDFKLYLFLNAQNIEPDEWTAIQKLKNNGKTLCFVHAPGIVRPENVGAKTPTEAIEKVTGIRVHATEGAIPLGVQPLSVVGEPVAQTSTQASTLPVNTNGMMVSYWSGTAPGFIVADARATPLGMFEGKGNAVAWRDFGNWKSVFFGGVGLSDTFVNALARRSGAWTASDAGDAVYANQNFITIHAMWDGEKTLKLLHPSKVIDMTDGKVVSEMTQTLKIPMQRGQTRWFYLHPNLIGF